MERSLRVLQHGNKKKLTFFQKSSKFEFWLLTKSWNHLSFVNISPTWVSDTSTERSSRVLQHGNQKIWFFFSKKFEIEFDLYFDLCWRAEIIQVGLNMHLYVDIGDASSSLWGSTSSFRRDHQKNFLWASRLWVGRRKEPILGYVPRNDKKKNSGGKGLSLKRKTWNPFYWVIILITDVTTEMFL